MTRRANTSTRSSSNIKHKLLLRACRRRGPRRRRRRRTNNDRWDSSVVFVIGAAVCVFLLSLRRRPRALEVRSRRDCRDAYLLSRRQLCDEERYQSSPVRYMCTLTTTIVDSHNDKCDVHKAKHQARIAGHEHSLGRQKLRRHQKA
jgi:hypothetical protein